MKLTPALQQGFFVGKKGVENSLTPASYNPNIAVSVNVLKSSFPEVQLKHICADRICRVLDIPDLLFSGILFCCDCVGC